jgi:glycine cleavage system regulatory protein
MTSLVVLVVGPDRPGLVEVLSNAIAEHGASWQESRMSRLAGHFAGILHVDVPADRVGTLTALLESLGQEGLEVLVRPSDAHPGQKLRHAHLDLVGSDRPGIIQRISQSLSRHGVNVNDLETEVTAAPMSGEQLFRARADLRLPDDLDVSVLRSTLESIGTDMMVDIKLEERAPQAD